MVVDRVYARPVPCPAGLPGAWSLAGGAFGFREVDLLSRRGPVRRLPVEAAAAIHPELLPVIERLDAPRKPVAGLPLGRPHVMGVVNVTPDSFSDGGQFCSVEDAVAHGLALVSQGAAVLDVGGESTRPGAEPVSEEEERRRVIPVIEGLVSAGCTVPISVDTRKAAVAEAARTAGAALFNDVSALTYDSHSAEVAARFDGLCLMHALGDPRVMQQDPRYEHVLLDIYDFLEERVAQAEAAGVARAQVLVDPGIGFGKTVAHNLALLTGASLFHGLGCAVLLGVSRKRFIGTLSGEPDAAARAPGSIAAGLMGLDQGVQLLRVHDVAETAQAIAVWRALADAPMAWGEQ